MTTLAQTPIPTPIQVLYKQQKDIAITAIGLRYLLIAALAEGKTRLDGSYSSQLIDLVRPAFAEAGWTIVDHGLSLTLRAIPPTHTPAAVQLPLDLEIPRNENDSGASNST